MRTWRESFARARLIHRDRIAWRGIARRGYGRHPRHRSRGVRSWLRRRVPGPVPRCDACDLELERHHLAPARHRCPFPHPEP